MHTCEMVHFTAITELVNIVQGESRPTFYVYSTKLFTTKNIEIVKYCQEYFGFALPSVLWGKRVSKFESGFKCILSVL